MSTEFDNSNEENTNLQDRPKPSHYVGVGASAGGLEALEEFFENMPANSGLAFIVVQHLSPDYKSMMVELLERKTRMRVHQVKDGMYIEPNQVYLIPPKKNLTIYHAQLFLNPQMRKSMINLPIDIFFRSLAIDQKKNAIGVILSGTGSDGTLGVKAIKEQGGLVVVQDFSGAKFDGMPRSAMGTGLVDYVLEAAKMGDALIKYVSHPNVIKDNRDVVDQAETDFVKILSLVRNNVAIDFSYYKPKTIVRRIERRISVNQLANAEDYVKLLLQDKEESEILAREFLIGVTQFFRDTEAYAILEEKVIPNLFVDSEKKKTIRLWSVGCSTGEEAYSLAILCNEYMENNQINVDLKIFATDLDQEAIRIAGQGIYPDNIVADVPEKYLNKYFIRNENSFQVNEKIRQLVVFAAHNIIADPPFSKISLVTCRNLLIYFKQEMQNKVLNMFQYSLSNGGYLFLGSSESLSTVANAFETLHQKWKVFKYKEGFSLSSYASLISQPGRARGLSSGHIAKTIMPPDDYKRQNHLADLYEQALSLVIDAGVIIDRENTIVHYLNDVQKYLSFPKGKPKYNLTDLLDHQLTMLVSNSIYKVRKERKGVNIRKFKFKYQNNVQFLDLAVKPIITNQTKQEYLIISFTEVELQVGEQIEDSPVSYNDEAVARIKDLERELQYRDENLQTTIEELETSNEELQATNEELVSSNEELQSTNEELQSVNEELYTVNSQYQSKITELTELNNDINNLLTNTKIGTIFLDSNLVIRKFTQAITKTLNVMDIDLGRPFSHITPNCDYSQMHKDAEEVLNTLISKEIEVKTKDNEWYLMKIQPYRHTDNSIHGLLITQINITALQKTRARNRMLSQSIEQSANSVIITDKNGDIEYINPKFTEVTGFPYNEVIGRNPRILQSGEHTLRFYQEMWADLLKGKTWTGLFRNRKKNGDLFYEHSTITAIKDASGHIINFLAIKEDISQQKEMDELLNLKRRIIGQTQKISHTGSWVLDLKTNKLEWSDEVYQILGIKKGDIEPSYENFLKYVHPEDKEILDKTFNEAIKADKEYKLQHRIVRPTGEVRIVLEQSEEIKDKNGNAIKSIGTVLDITEQVKIKDEQKMLINSLPLAFAYHQIITDKNDQAIDYKFLTANKVFEKLTGFDSDKIIGKTVKELMPDTENFWIEKFAKVAQTGEKTEFHQYSKALKNHYKGTAYSPKKGYFAVIFTKTEAPNNETE